MAVAACLGRDPSHWVGSDSLNGGDALARATCRRCSVRPECVDYALTMSAAETPGLWGGLGPARRTQLRRKARRAKHRYRRGCECAYCVAVTKATDLTGARVNKNSPGARCGYISTYGKGCRCRGCRQTSSYRGAAKPRGIEQDAPVVVLLDDTRCDRHDHVRCRVCIFEHAVAA